MLTRYRAQLHSSLRQVKSVKLVKEDNGSQLGFAGKTHARLVGEPRALRRARERFKALLQTVDAAQSNESQSVFCCVGWRVAPPNSVSSRFCAASAAIETLLPPWLGSGAEDEDEPPAREKRSEKSAAPREEVVVVGGGGADRGGGEVMDAGRA